MDGFADSRLASSVVATGVGVVVGSALRNLPVSIVDLIFAPDRDAIDCGAEGAAACALRVAPVAIVEVARFGLAVFAVAMCLALIGAVGTASGWHRLRTATPEAAGHRVGASTTADRLTLGLLACGTALMMPALWFAGSFVAAVVT